MDHVKSVETKPSLPLICRIIRWVPQWKYTQVKRRLYHPMSVLFYQRFVFAPNAFQIMHHKWVKFNHSNKLRILTHSFSFQYIPIDGFVLRQGGYVLASAEIGSVTLNDTKSIYEGASGVRFQDFFFWIVNRFFLISREHMKWCGEKPVPIWLDDNEANVG